LSGFSTPRMLATRPSRNEGTSTSSGRPSTVRYQPSWPFTRTGSTRVPDAIRDARFTSNRATRSAPTTGRRAARRWAPPSERWRTSSVSSRRSPSTSPWMTAPRKAAASSSAWSGSASTRGRSACTRSRARLAIWRAAASERSTWAATSAKGYPKTSWSRNTARSTGSSRSSTVRKPRVRDSAVATVAKGSSSPTGRGSGSHGPTYTSRRRRADRRRSMARRVVTVVSHAAGSATAARSVDSQRSQASWTTSSASSGMPSIR
jgi:hypothetical protein